MRTRRMAAGKERKENKINKHRVTVIIMCERKKRNGNGKNTENEFSWNDRMAARTRDGKGGKARRTLK